MVPAASATLTLQSHQFDGPAIRMVVPNIGGPHSPPKDCGRTFFEENFPFLSSLTLGIYLEANSTTIIAFVLLLATAAAASAVIQALSGSQSAKTGRAPR